MKYKISDLAKILNVTTNTLRRYEEQGYIKSSRDENSGYRYYTEEDVFEFMNIRLMRKYGFSHKELEKMEKYNLTETITAYEDKLKQMDEEIKYLTYVRHRIKDDLLLMNKTTAIGDEVYKKDCMDLLYVLYKENEKLCTEPERLETISEYLYTSPEVQRIYLIKKGDIDKGKFSVNMGWAVKEVHMEKYGLHKGKYTVRYNTRPSIMGMVTIPVKDMDINVLSADEIKNLFIKKHLQYMEKHDLKIAGDIIGIIITRAMENDEEVQHLLVSVPIE